MPISLQYGDYTAHTARAESLAGGDPLEKSTNRGYQGKRSSTKNRLELDRVLNTRHRMGKKPVIVVISATRPFVPAEFEPAAPSCSLSAYSTRPYWRFSTGRPNLQDSFQCNCPPTCRP